MEELSNNTGQFINAFHYPFGKPRILSIQQIIKINIIHQNNETLQSTEEIKHYVKEAFLSFTYWGWVYVVLTISFKNLFSRLFCITKTGI